MFLSNLLLNTFSDGALTVSSGFPIPNLHFQSYSLHTSTSHIILNKVCFQPDGMLEDKYVPVVYTHRDNETNSWMPLYLASDVLAFESIGNCNKSRIHASFAKQGLATKITLPTGVKFSRLPAGNSNGVWFYSVYGVIQAVMQYLNSQEEQIRLIEEFMSIWKLRVNDALLPQKLDHFTVVNKSRSIPMPVDLQQNASYLSRNSSQSTVGSADDEEMLVSCIIPSSGCVVGSKRSRTDSIAQRLDEELFDVPDVAVEVSVSSDSLCQIPSTRKEGSSPTEGRGGIKMERNFVQPEVSSHPKLRKV
ncbi:hypothetical protein BSL78_12251 [Apostichopus japonicus]|uniref:Uncharacterized protein n=1 Tax=Stichopus japonicus TaxID=307972 RepID=A0A2G8KSF7_STIJA|nr:hypothetical protein BSL78_12251 [Apostichopus japonicus]